MIIKRKNSNNYMEKYPLNEDSLLSKEEDWNFDDPNKKEEIFEICQNEKKIAEIQMFFYTDKAYAIISQVHFFDIKKSEMLEVLKTFVAHLFLTSQLPYPILEIKCRPDFNHLDSDTLEMCGFLMQFEECLFFAILNPDFIEIISQKKEINIKKFIDLYFQFQTKSQTKLNEWNKELKEIYDFIIKSLRINSKLIEEKKKEIEMLRKKIKQQSLFIREDSRYINEFLHLDDPSKGNQSRHSC